MSNSKIFTVYDSKAEAYLQPFFMQSAGAAIRAFEQAANTEDHQFHLYAADFTLFELGEFDEDTAQITTHPTPISLGIAVEFFRPVDQVIRSINPMAQEG